MENVRPGKYKHFKGAHYRVSAVARHSETGEELVVYEALRDGGIWVRPLTMFLEDVDVDGEQVPRFRYIGN